MNRNGVRPRRATITLRLDGNIKDAADYYAKQRQVPLAEVVRTLLVDYVDACARENERAAPDLLGSRPPRFPEVPLVPAAGSAVTPPR